MTVSLVAAVGTNGVIGLDGGLPWPPTGDLAHFKALTMGHVLVMGRKTFESIGRVLPGRTTIVVSRRRKSLGDGVLVVPGVEEAIERAAALDPEVFVVGGAQVYAVALPLADRLVLTHVDLAPEGDTYLPDVDWARWHETSRLPGNGFDVVTYDRV